MKATRRTVIWTSVMVLLLMCVSGVSRADEPNRAGLIVDFGNGNVIISCVEFTETEITSAELLRREGLNVLTRSTSGVGEDVCKIADVGCDDPEDCFCECQESPCSYWSHWYWDAGEWQYAGMGDGSSTVSDGAIEGWVWGDQSTQPPAMDYEQLCVPPADASPTTSGVPAPSSTSAPWSPYPDDEETEEPGETPESTETPPPSATPWSTDTARPTVTPRPTYTLWPTDTPLPTVTAPGSVNQVVVTPTLGDAYVIPTNTATTATVTPSITATEPAVVASPQATQEQPVVVQSPGMPTLDRVASVLSTQVAETRATPQPVLLSASRTWQRYLAIVPVAVLLLALAGYVILLRRQRVRDR